MSTSNYDGSLPPTLREKLLACGVAGVEHLTGRTLEDLLSVCRLDLAEIAVLLRYVKEVGVAFETGPTRFPFISPLLVGEVVAAGVDLSETSIASIGLPAWAEEPLVRGGLTTVRQLADASTFYVRAALGRGGRPQNILRQHVEEHLLGLIRSVGSAQQAEANGGIPQSAQLSPRTRGALRRAGIFTLDQLHRLNDAELRRLRGLGPKGIEELQTFLPSATKRPVPGTDIAVQAEAVAVRPDVSRRSIRVLALPEPLIARLESDGLRTIGAIVKGGDARLRETPRVGAAAVKRVRTELERYLLTTLEEVGPEVETVVAEVQAAAREASLDQRIASLIGRPRSKRLVRVLSMRAGLDGRIHTLEEIGHELGVSRERARQLETIAILELQQEHRPEVEHLSRPAYEALVAVGGVAPFAYLEEQLAILYPIDRINTPGAARLLLRLMDAVVQLPGGRAALADAPLREIDQIDDAVVTYLRKRLEFVSIAELVAELARVPAYPVTIQRYPSFSVAARARANRLTTVLPTGTVGLKEWDRTRLNETVQVLRSLGLPTHYRDIAAGVQAVLPAHMSISVQAVHNLLLSEAAFMRAERGVFGLAEWQQAPGEILPDLVTVLAASETPMHHSEVASALALDERTVERYLITRPEFSPAGHGYYKLAGRDYKQKVRTARRRTTEVLRTEGDFPGRTVRIRVTHSTHHSGTLALNADLRPLFPQEGDLQVTWPGSLEPDRIRKLHRGKSHISGLGRFLHAAGVRPGDAVYLQYSPVAQPPYRLHTEAEWRATSAPDGETEPIGREAGA